MRVGDHFSLFIVTENAPSQVLLRLAEAFKKLMLMFYHCFRATTDVSWAVKTISSLLIIEICVHVIDNVNNEIRGGGVERDGGTDEKQLIKFA